MNRVQGFMKVELQNVSLSEAAAAAVEDSPYRNVFQDVTLLCLDCSGGRSAQHDMNGMQILDSDLFCLS
ncbi:hypothetical protein CLV60_11746 [Dyadobacter jiangsuensis]|uniref:Uncharacterized protein n=2 Tax=Dyadobacter jiangsuensis TaxID=1591085 RepID=A0A2P8FN74_9BACT|nr:hypothetical protein CLV60_11746 [Dyadobacter jiangsuensis]